LLLSPTAEFDAKPELEIYADDVVCGHGATAGDLDEDLVFYLRTRGIPLREARALLVSAFAAEAFEDIAHDQIRDRLEQLSREWLQRRIEQ
jgi:Fe-S cluster assembly protein SufD